MRDLLNTSFFPHVIKPGRYAGGELGRIVKSHDGRTSYLHIYPDKYELGMSHVGLQMLYNIINGDDRFICERAFAPDIDAEELMRREEIPLFSLESRTAARDFDAVGFSLVDETVYTNMLTLLELARIPILSADRDDSHPLILAGGPAVYNPEPIAPFVDVVFLGDAEIGLPEMLAVIANSRDATRADKLERLCRQVESVYVPAFYDNARRPQRDYAPSTIRARLCPELKAEYYPDQPLVPLTEIAHEHLGIEIMRGCPQGCRFCMASPIYKPVRVRPAAEVIAQIEKQLATTGYGQVTLLSLSSSDYPNIESLASTLARRLEPQRVSLSLPSLRPGSITAATLNALSRVRVASLTIAPEAGTERLRLFIRKDFPDEAILDTARLAFDNGINSIKLYFMIGLPTETEEDLLGIVDLCQRIHQVAASFPGRRSLTITLSPFVPKPHTPFQWDAALSDSEQFKRIQFVRRKLRLSNTTVRHNSTRLAQLVAAVGRGDRSIAEAVRIAHSKGCRFDGWTEHFDWDRWQAAFSEAGISLSEELAARSFEHELPWSHIEKGQSVAKLREERQRTSLKMRDYVSPEPANTIQSAEPTVQFGRSKKRSPGRAVVAPTKNKVRLKWGRSERFRYMSHLDTLRLLERTLRRSRLPVAYSQGFNPTMKLSFGPPLSVGFTSEYELLEIVLDQNWSPSMLEQLRGCVPEGLDLHQARVVHMKAPSLASVLNRASYSVDLSNWNDIECLVGQISDVLSAETLDTERTTKSKTKTIDIRPALYRLDIEADRLNMLLGIGEGGYARPDEITRLLEAGLAVPAKAVAVHRTGLFRSDEADALIEGIEV